MKGWCCACVGLYKGSGSWPSGSCLFHDAQFERRSKTFSLWWLEELWHYIWCILLVFKKVPFSPILFVTKDWIVTRKALSSSPKDVSVEDVCVDVLGSFAEEVKLRILDKYFIWIWDPLHWFCEVFGIIFDMVLSLRFLCVKVFLL